MSIAPAEWNEERKQLETVAGHIRSQLAEVRDIVERRKSDVLDIRKEFWDEIKFDPDEEIETFANLKQQSRLLNSQERIFQQALDKMRKLEKMLNSPYFGRIDFVEQGSSHRERIYIGIASLVEDETDEILVFDWRAPISSMFYDYSPGRAEYRTPVSVIEGELLLKRQFIIEGGKLETMFDTGLHIGDEILKRMLGRSADDKMRSIVTTIQREQNRIIRDADHRVLIVQGAAGSGKTSAALQRVAYLLYRYRDQLNADDMILFSPNPLFNDYVSNVLPELGEANMRQTTFYEYVERQLGERFAVEHPYTQLERLLSCENETEYAAEVSGIEYKASTGFIRVLNNYAEWLKTEGMIFKPFELPKRTLISDERLAELFYVEYAHAPISGRLERMERWIVEYLEEQSPGLVRLAYRKLLREPRYIGTEEELLQMSKRIVRKRLEPLKERAKKLDFIDIHAMYLRLFKDRALFEKLAAGTGIPADWDGISVKTAERLEKGEIPWEDATPLLYFKELIEGVSAFNNIRHVIIDESQDYSPFQYEYLRRMFPRSRMTLLGDLNQAIYAHTNLESYDPVRDIFGGENTGTIRLTKSYRSTEQIVEFTRAMLPDGEMIEAFSRSGDKPKVLRAASGDRLPEGVARHIREMRANGFKSIAVICKTADESRKAYESLKHLGGVYLITKDTYSFVTGTLVIPAYLAKGLEFDGVIIYDAGKLQYGRERERKLFYTACTRALHDLRIFYTGELTPFVAHVDDGLYDSLEE